MKFLRYSFLLYPAALAAGLHRRCDNQTVITDDAYFYGQSPPVYPTPEMLSDGQWAEAYAKAKALVSQMTLEERANITVGQATTGCTGATGSVPRLGFPGLCFAGATAGVKTQELVNGYAGGIHTGASWNKDMALQRAVHMAREFWVKGAQIQGAPLIGPLGRVPRGGRNNGGFSNDPYLAGQMAAVMVQGIESQGVMATAKHYIGNEQESYRMNKAYTTTTDPVSSNIDDRTMHELYLWPWADVVRAGTHAIMCSYNRLNNSYACQNSKSINGLLKGELGFQGWVMTDWGAMNGGIASALAGLDAVFPDGDLWAANGSALVTAVNNGSMPESRLNDMVTRMLTPWYYLSQDTGVPPGWGTTTNFLNPHRKVYARDPASKPIILQNAIEGHVLVKNINNSLPLHKPQMVSVYGYDAPAPSVITDMVTFHGFSTPAAYNGTLINGGGSEACAPAYISAPFDAIQARAYEDGTSLFWDFDSENPLVNPNSDACLVFINAWATEGADRSALQDDFSDNLIINVAKKCSNTMVFVHNAGIRLVDRWIDHPNVTAVMFAHIPGQDSGRALAALIYGDISPSGKLPYTVAMKEDDYSVGLPDLPEGIYQAFPQSNFTEGLYIDYRWFDQANIAPRFEFGFGMTYTTFQYSDLKISLVPELSSTPQRPPAQATKPGGNPALWDILVNATVEVKNTGSVEAAEVAQLYVGIPGGDTPVRQLRGFDKKNVTVGGSAMFSFGLTRKDLSVWDIVQQDWVLRRGEYLIHVGASSRDLPLNATFVI
ncbi:hypothetical protein GQ53DRAFT_889949 [Thozetella sp. PMI_491]|nr:hypothetical protein GQ53DRAFT_889949 [Thozetella sp. PMI_491]